MKPIIIVSILVLSITSCKDKTQGPTIFEGKVVYEDDGSPFVDGTVFIVPYISSLTPGCCSKGGQGIIINDSGFFDIVFDYDEEIDYFNLRIKPNDGGVISTIVGGLNCSPYDCDDFEPGKAYNDLVIKVLR